MELIYDNEGNLVGEAPRFSSSPLGKFMNENVDFIDDAVEEVEEEPKRILRDPEAVAALPLFRTLSLEELENLPEPEWIINGILPADAMVTIFGAPGSTKSFWALDIACSIASGTTFNAEEVRKGAVIYAVGEGLRGIKWRIEAWKMAHPDADMEALNKNLIILPRSVMLLDKVEAGMLLNTAEMVNETVPLRAFIIDTWARALTGGEENSAKDTGIAISVCESVRAKTGASPIIVHHTGTEGTRERGSTALRGATDTSILMAKDEVTGTVSVTCKKMKDGEPFKPIRYELKSFGHSIILEPISGGSSSVGYTPQVRDKEYWVKKAIADRDAPF